MIDQTYYPIENAKALFEICKTEYVNEKTRTSAIDTKASVVIALVSGVYVFLLGVVKDRFVFLLDADTISLLMLISLICTYSTVVFGFSTCYNLYEVIKFKKYMALDPDYYMDAVKLRLDSSIYSIVCSKKYSQALKFNRIVNSKRKVYFNRAVLFFGLSLFSIAIQLILSFVE